MELVCKIIKFSIKSKTDSIKTTVQVNIFYGP